MFDGLDQIAWHTLSYTYGAADEVPKWLRALATWDGRDESDAFTELSLALYHHLQSRHSAGLFHVSD